MAFTTTSRRWSGVARVALGSGVVAATALIALAAPASAHTPRVTAACEDGKTTLTVNLVNYNTKHGNTVKVTDGEEVLVEKAFEAQYSKTWELAADVDHEFTVTVAAWDDPKSEKGWSFTKTLTVEACAPQEPPVEEPPAEQPPAEQPPAEQPPAQAPPAQAAPVASAGLANTGVSIFVPLGLGVLLLAGGGALVLMRKRRGTS